MQKFGFTLIELLVVITIIAILGSVATVMYGAVRERARTGAANADLRQIADAIELARTRSNKTLMQINGGNTCSVCVCDTSGTFSWRDYLPGDLCRVYWNNALINIQAQGAAVEKLVDMKNDPWGAPYGLDENEGEFPTNPCRKDDLRTVGPDSKWNTPDDIVINIPFSLSTCL